MGKLLPFILLWATFSVVMVVANANDCETQQAITPQGLQKLTQNALRSQLGKEPNWIKDMVNKSFHGSSKTIPGTLPNFFLDGSLRGGKIPGPVEHQLSNMNIGDLKAGDPVVTCTPGPKCKLRVPIKSLSLETDYKIKCLSPRCAGQNLLDYEKLKLGFDQTNAKNPPVIEFDVDITPGVPIVDALVVDPNSVAFDIPFETLTALDLDLKLTQDEWIQVYNNLGIKESFDCRTEKTSSQLRHLIKQSVVFDEIKMKAMYEELKPWAKSESSVLMMTFFVAGSEVLRRAVASGKGFTADEKEELTQVQKEMSRIISQALKDKLGPPLAAAANKALREAPFMKTEVSGVIPVMTAKQTVGDLNLDKDKAIIEQSPHFIKVTGTSATTDGSIVVHASGCNPPDTTRSSPRYLPPEGSDVGGSIPLEEVNRYLSKVTADPSQNKFSLRAGGNGIFAKIPNRKSHIDLKELKLVTDKDSGGVNRPYIEFVAEEEVTTNSPLSLISKVTGSNKRVNKCRAEMIIDGDGQFRPGEFKCSRELGNRDVVAKASYYISGAIGGFFVPQAIVNNAYRGAISKQAKGVDLNKKLPYQITHIEVPEDGKYINYSANVIERETLIAAEAARQQAVAAELAKKTEKKKRKQTPAQSPRGSVR